MPQIAQVPGREGTIRVVVDGLKDGLVTRSFPTEIPDTALFIADNAVFNRDGLVSKRPGNAKYGGGSGATGSGAPGLAGTRFYPAGGPKLLVHSGTQLYQGTDLTGAFSVVGTGLTSLRGAAFAQQRDPDMSTGNAIALFVVDGSTVPHVYDGLGHYVPVSTAAGFLPNGIVTGTPIKPSFCLNWREHMVYAGDPDDPSALWISDAFRPERFSGYAILDSAGTTYIPYYPGGADGALGVITGLAEINGKLVILFTSGVVVCTNTGTYGAFQYTFETKSSTTGNVAPRSLAVFEGFGVFFGGDRFYATDASSVVPLPDDVPSIYANSAQSAFPSEMRNRATVVGGRRGTQYWAAYDNTGTGRNSAIAVFDLGANGGYAYGSGLGGTTSGGAWSRWPTGMPLSWLVECRGPGDSQQLFWGSSASDLVLAHDTGTYDDWGSDIAFEARTKSFFLDAPLNPKKVGKLYVLGSYPALAATYTDTVRSYVTLDAATTNAPGVAETIAPTGTPYGALAYGTFFYGSSQQIIQRATETFPQVENTGRSVAFGVSETSKNPFNLIGFMGEVIIDPVPT